MNSTMLKVFFISIALVVFPLFHPSYAEIVDESWRQVYEFQSTMAAQGNNEAQYTLGEMYEHGRGVQQDYDTAIEWYNKAKLNGHSEASERIAIIHKSIQQEAADKKKADAQRKAEQELARQKALEQQREEEARHKEQAQERKLEKKTKKVTKKKKIEQAKFSPEERAKKIKEAQERAKAIALQNQLKQQQESKAALERDKKKMMSSKAPESKKHPNNLEKYIDPFE